MLTQARMAPSVDSATTRDRILVIAGELFVEKTYAGTSMSDIAARVGTTKAAIYHHFASKDAILVEVLSGNIAAMARMTELANRTRPRPGRQEIFDGLVSMFADSPLGSMLLSDPSVCAAYKRYYNGDETRRLVIDVIAGPSPSDIGVVRAGAAIAAVRDATLTVMTSHGVVRPVARRAIVDIGMRIVEIA